MSMTIRREGMQPIQFLMFEVMHDPDLLKEILALHASGAPLKMNIQGLLQRIERILWLGIHCKKS